MTDIQIHLLSRGIFIKKKPDFIENPEGGWKIIYDNIEFIPNIADFQVVFRDKDGNELVPVCTYCGPVENSQGSRATAQANMQKVHTAEIYLTIRSSKEVYKNNRKEAWIIGRKLY